MKVFGLIKSFLRTSIQEDLAYRSNFWIKLLHSILNLIVAFSAILILFTQIEAINGWSFQSTVGVLAVYLIVSALRDLFIGPSLEKLAGMGQEILNGQFDFSLIRPVNIQFLVTFSKWRIFATLDLFLGVGVFLYALFSTSNTTTWTSWVLFGIALTAGIIVLYALLLGLCSIAFWSPGFMITWLFDALFQLARYPIGIYPPLVRIVLTWIIPIGLITTVPVQALNAEIGIGMVLLSLSISLLLFIFSSWLFRQGVNRYQSASS